MLSSCWRQHERAWRLVREADGILVPGGFGDRGIEGTLLLLCAAGTDYDFGVLRCHSRATRAGMILAANYARVHKKPYFGICLGLQVAVIE